MPEIVMHESEHDYAKWAHGECVRLEKHNALLKVLLLKALIELRKHDERCAEALRALTPNCELTGRPPQADGPR